MILAELLADYEGQLVAVGEEPESLSFAYRALEDLTFTDFVLRLRQEVTPEDERLLSQLLKDLKAHKPAQYLIGWAEFHGHRFKVDERVLIPRPETEELVDLILMENPEAEQTLLDIGTGSGAIALSLKMDRPSWQVTASDVSKEALELAQENASSLQADVAFLQSDVYEGIRETFDLIVSNPPYIAYEDKDEVGMNVFSSEPHLALFAEDQGLAIYRKIAQGAGQCLNEQGKIYLEIGYKQGQAVKDLFAHYFPEKRIRVLEDQFGQDRMVVIDDGED